jgi:hypothetical protein
MKRALILISTVLVGYSLTFLALKLSRPAFVVTGDDAGSGFAAWYGTLSHPARYVSASLFGDARLKDGVFTFEDRIADGSRVFLKDPASGIVYRLDVADVPAIDHTTRLEKGCAVQVTFRCHLFSDANTFEDRFFYSIDDITTIGAK